MGPGETVKRLPGGAARRTAAVIVLVSSWAIAARSAEPIAGDWQMISQKMGDAVTKPLPIAIKIRQEGSKLTFTYVAGREQEVKMTFSVYLDARPAPIMNGAGIVIGTATLKKSGAKYELVLQSRGKRPEPGTMAISEHGNILTCESTVDLPDRGATHIVQVFSREPQ